ncbi:MAG TPA: sugar phosphate isomerase/epimerase family protein [Pirellulales bacterium]|jgi:sugar phosphate isomerase/epimerase|nr:sugar phosphate isomerase/epimerase family protein [Pirellulales bacterium]
MKFSYIMCEPVPNLAELTARMRRLAEFGYQGVELSATHPLGFEVDALAAAAEQIRLPVVSLLSGWSYSNEGLCLVSPDEAIRDRAVERLNEYVGIAQRLGALVVVGLMQGLRSDEPDLAVANRRISDALARVARSAEDRGVRLVMEPVNHLQVGFHHTAAAVSELVERMGSPAAGLMLDTIHMNIEERSMLQTIRQYGDRIDHFHLCESSGGPFGSGNLDFAAVLAALDEVGYDQYVSIKIYRDANWEDGARSAMDFLRRLEG